MNTSTSITRIVSGSPTAVFDRMLLEPVLAPLTAGLLRPITADARLVDEKRHRLDRLYQRIGTDLDALLQAVGSTHGPHEARSKMSSVTRLSTQGEDCVKRQVEHK